MIEVGPLSKSLSPGSLGGIILSPLERDLINGTTERVVPIERRVEVYLDFLIRLTSKYR